MQYRRFPRIPETPVSVLSFGCMRLPTLHGDPNLVDEERATRLLRAAVDAGVNYVDTAYPYHGGTSELVVGRALRDGYRARVILATKHPVWLVRTPSDWERYLDEQLGRLGTNHIDVYLLHALSGERWEVVRRHHGLAALERARADGRIRFTGFSFHGSPDDFRVILDGFDWDLCQVQYNFLDVAYQAGTAGVAHAASRGVGVVAMEPLRGGALADRVPEVVQAIWARLHPRRSPAGWALRWVWNDPGVVTALSGMGSEAQLAENLAAAEKACAGAMDATELAAVAEVRQHYHRLMPTPCTTCGYCLPCPSGVAIPDVFSIYSTASMFGSTPGLVGWYRGAYVSQGHGGDACIGCHACEAACPQGIPIAHMLSEAHRHLTS